MFGERKIKLEYRLNGIKEKGEYRVCERSGNSELKESERKDKGEMRS